MKKLFSNDPAQRRSLGNILKFMALLLVFTLVARGTSGATLARVELEEPTRSEIVDAVVGNAVVSTAATMDITAPSGLEVEEMFINPGQEVDAGDAIAAFVLSDIEYRFGRESTTLERMRFDLSQLERNESVDSSSLDTARRNHTRAVEDYEATVLQNEADIMAAFDALEELLNDPATVADDTALQTAIRNYLRAFEDFNALVAQNEADIAAAHEALEEALERLPEDVDRTSVDNARRQYTRARDDYNATITRGQENIRNARDALLWAIEHAHRFMFIYPPDPVGEMSAWAAVQSAQAAVDSAESAAESSRLTAARMLEDAQANYAAARRNFSDAGQGEIERIETAVENAQTALEAAQTRAANSLAIETRRLEDAEINLEQAQRSFSTSLENLADAAVTEIERAQNAIQTAIALAEDRRLSAARRVEDNLASLITAQQTHQRTLLQNSTTAMQNSITASTLRMDLAAQEAVVKSLNELILAEGILFADYGGIVSHAVQQGVVTGTSPVVVMRDTLRGFEAQMTISVSEAERLSIGSQAEVTTGGGTMFFTPTTIGIVSAISEPDENDRVTITIVLPGNNWSVGQRIDAEIVIHRANFDMSVPVSALRSDNFGYFVYVVAQRNTILGLQNIVERINVEVVASDGEMVAIRGPVARDSQVIVGSNKAVSVGDRVRVA